MKLQRFVLLCSTLVVSSALFAQNVTPRTPSAKQSPKPVQVAQAQSAAGGETAPASPTWVAPTAIAAGVIAVGLVIANQEDDNRTPTRPK